MQFQKKARKFFLALQQVMQNLENLSILQVKQNLRLSSIIVICSLLWLFDFIRCDIFVFLLRPSLCCTLTWKMTVELLFYCSWRYWSSWWRSRIKWKRVSHSTLTNLQFSRPWSSSNIHQLKILSSSNMVRQVILVSVAIILGMVSAASARSCQDQADSRGVQCVAAGKPCKSGFKPVLYDNPYPCSSGSRCCVAG